MREIIKFRQPRISKGKFVHWHYWGYVDEHKGHFVAPLPPNTGGDSYQYTGIKDKNGKEIWEGDIIKIKDKYPIRKIVYCPYEAAFVASDIKWQAYFGLAGITDNYDCEIIGNIHEHPELLEVES